MNGHEAEIALLIIGAIATGFVQQLFASRKDMGRRIGRIEKRLDWEAGRRAGRREKVQERNAR